MKFSANLGFLWADLDLPVAIRAAGEAGFDAVECHAPYAFGADEISAALKDTGLSMLSLNTKFGGHGEAGVAALPGRESTARQCIDQAIEYAAAIDCPKVHVLAGRSDRGQEAEHVYRENLSYATGRASFYGLTVLIEPLNTNDMADYHLVSADRAAETIEAVGADNLKLMIDCFHTSVMHGAVEPVLERVMPHIGHIQFASIPDRGEPDRGELDYQTLLPWLVELGYDGLFGAEYHPTESVESGLGWLHRWHEHRTGGVKP